MNNIRILYVCRYFITKPLTCVVTNECCFDLTYLCCLSPLWGSLCYCGSLHSACDDSKCACYVGAGILIYISVLYQVVFVLLQMEI